MKKKRYDVLLGFALSLCIGSLWAQQPNETWPSSLRSVPFKPVPISETPAASYIINHHTLLPQQLEELGLTDETWKRYPEVWAAYRPQLPGNFFPVVIRTLDRQQIMHSFLVIFDSSWALVSQKEIMHQEIGETTRQTKIGEYSLIINDRSNHRGKSEQLLLLENGGLEAFNYYHRSVQSAVESLTRIWVRPLQGAVLWRHNAEPYDTLPFATGLRVLRHNDKLPASLADGEYYTAVLDYDRYLKNAQVPRQGDSLAYIRKSDAVPPIAYHTDENGRTYAGPDKHYSRLVYSNMNFEPFLQIDSVGLEQYEVIYSEKVEEQRYALGEKKEWTVRFENGEARTFKDSTYQSEYSPTSYFRLFKNPALPNDYLIYAPFFEDSYFYLFSGVNGDTLYRFLDYPFYSPNKKLVVSMSVPFTYDTQEATLELVMLSDKQYTEAIQLTFVNWNFANDRQIHWLSDKDFLIKATAPHAFHEEEPKPFYLRFRFRPEYFK